MLTILLKKFAAENFVGCFLVVKGLKHMQLAMERRHGQGLEQLDYGAEGRCKVASSRLGYVMRQLENSLSTQQ